MAGTPDILTNRLRITPFAERHLTERYVDWLNDADLMRFSEQRHKRHTLGSCRLYWRSFEGTPNHFWAIEETVAGLGHIGNVNAYVDERNGIADVGLLIGEARARGKHYGFEAWVGVCHYLLAGRGLRKVTGGALAVNTPMLKIMRRARMADDGIRRRHHLVDGREVDVVHMAAFGAAWLAWLASSPGEEARRCLPSPS